MIVEYWRRITCEFFGKSAFAGTFKIEVDASGVPVSPLNYESLSGDGISSVAYYENNNELQVNGTNDGVAVMHNFSTATEDTTYNERDPEGTWSYTAETVSFDTYDIIISTDWTGETGGRSWLVFMKYIDETSFGATYKYSNTFDDTTGVGTLTIKEATTLPDGVLYNNTHILSVEMPECFTTIGDAAFAGCSNMVTINLPNTIEVIGADAFSECTSLTEITLPESLTTIGEGALDACESLESVICLAPVPPTTGTTISNITLPELQVPPTSLSAYMNDPVWGDAFTTIKSLPGPTPYRGYGFNKTGMIDVDFLEEVKIRLR